MSKSHLFSALRNVTAFALPISMGGIVNALSGFISMMMVAQLGKEQLAAGALAVPTFMTIMTVTVTIFYSVGILISHDRGQNKPSNEIGLIVKNGISLAILFSILAGLSLWYVDKILLIFKQDPRLVALTRGYFHFAAWNMLPMLIGAVIGQFYSGIGRPRFSLIYSLVSLVLTIIVAYGLILGRLGMPQLGLSGITCAGFIVQTILIVMLLLLMFFSKGFKVYQLFSEPFLPSWHISKSIIKLGLPIGMQFGGEFIAITVVTYLLGWFGVAALAASQLVSQYYMLIIVFLIGLTQALALLTSKAYGENNYQAIKLNLQASIIILMIACFAASILFCFFPKELIALYINKKDIDIHFEYLTTIFFSLSAILLFVDGMRHVLSGALRGLYDSQGPMRIGIIGLWFISLPLAYLIGFVFHGGPIGLRIGFLSGFIFAAGLLVIRINKKLQSIKQIDMNNV